MSPIARTKSSSPETEKLTLRNYGEFTHREISTKPPRDCMDNEIPIIDVSRMDGELEGRIALSAEILLAAETSGFFYIKNHGIKEDIINDALKQTKE